MSTYYNDMRAALDTRLTTLAGSTPIAWENTNYKADADTEFLRSTFIPSDTSQYTLGDTGKDVTRGLYQVDVFAPAQMGRTTKPDSIADHFKRGTILTKNATRVRIRSVSVGRGTLDGAWYIVPVTMNFETITEART